MQGVEGLRELMYYARSCCALVCSSAWCCGDVWRWFSLLGARLRGNWRFIWFDLPYPLL